MRLHAGNKISLPVLGVGWRLLPVVANPKIECQVVQDVPVVLRKCRVVEVVGIGIFAGVLLHAVGFAGDKVREGIVREGAGGCGETEDAIVVQRSLLEVLLQAGFTAKIERMLAAGRVENIANAVLVGAGLGPGNRLSQSEPVGVTDLSARWSTGDTEVGAKISERAVIWNRNAAGKLPRVAEPRLVDGARADRPCVANVGVLLRGRIVWSRSNWR